MAKAMTFTKNGLRIAPTCNAPRWFGRGSGARKKTAGSLPATAIAQFGFSTPTVTRWKSTHRSAPEARERRPRRRSSNRCQRPSVSHIHKEKSKDFLRVSLCLCVSVVNSCSGFYAELLPAFLADAAGVPGRVPDHIHFNRVHARHVENGGADVLADLVVRGAARRGQGHLNDDVAFFDLNSVDKPQIHDIQRNLRVVAEAQPLHDVVTRGHAS